MNPADYINKYGGKAGGWFYLRDFGGFEEHLLPLYFLPPGADVNEIEDILPEPVQNNWILRGTHRNDHYGFVDILDSDKFFGFGESRKAVMINLMTKIKDMRDNAKRPEIFEYSEYEGQDYDGEIGIAIQPLNTGMKGSVVEHPNERGTYLIDLVDPIIGHNFYTLDRLVVRGNEVDERDSYIIRVTDFHAEAAEKIVSLYNKVRDTNYIPPEISFQMEFGINQDNLDNEMVLFYQARPFLMFEEPPFKMEDDFLVKYGCFGITPEEGVTLPVVKTMYHEGVNSIPYDFAWVIQRMTARISAHARPRNMKAFLPIGLRVYSLEHNTYRWVMKADVSVLDPSDGFEFDELQIGDSVRIISNGLYHMIEKA